MSIRPLAWKPPSAEELCHGLRQGFLKRQLPRSVLFDNGSAMVAAETEQGLTRLSIFWENTLPFSPYQNGKQEAFWGQIEGRLLPMLEGLKFCSALRLLRGRSGVCQLGVPTRFHLPTRIPP